MIENADGEYLLQRRNGTGYLDGYYDVSGSGHLEYGESIEHCAVRELYEEVRLVVDESDLELITIFQSDFETDIRYINIIYRASRFSGDLANGEPTKIDDLEWFDPRMMPPKLTVGARVFLRALDEGMVKNYYIGPSEYRQLMGETFGEN